MRVPFLSEKIVGENCLQYRFLNFFDEFRSVEIGTSISSLYFKTFLVDVWSQLEVSQWLRFYFYWTQFLYLTISSLKLIRTVLKAVNSL